MSISATMVKDLREKTNAGMMDCKRALQETQGNFEDAIEWLRKKGLASAAKKADRLASEGMVSAFVKDGKAAVLMEVNSETDFVAKNELFRNFVNDLAKFVGLASKPPTNAESLLTETLPTGKTVLESLNEFIAKIGENLVVRRFVRLDTSGYLHTYVHGDGKIAVAVELTTDGSGDEIKALANDICLHAAAMSPISLSPEDVPAEIVAKEKEILKAKNLEQGKKAEMVDKIVEGQIRKFLAESCLLEQAFVKNPDIKVKDYVAEVSKKIGKPISIKQFVRFELGEGLQKKSNNFAEEVAAQTKGH